MNITQRFASHVASQKGCGGSENHILFKNPASGFDAIAFIILDKSRLVVTGDLGDAIYKWSGNPAISWQWLANLDFDYFCKKCVASAVGVPFRQWNEAKAKGLLIARLNELGEEGCSAWEFSREELLEGIEFRGALFSYETWQNYRYHDIVWADALGDPSDVVNWGWEPHLECKLHFEALKLAVGQLSGEPSA